MNNTVVSSRHCLDNHIVASCALACAWFLIEIHLSSNSSIIHNSNVAMLRAEQPSAHGDAKMITKLITNDNS